MTNTTKGSFLDDLQSAVQANPLPAALIGIGALWLLMGGGRTTAAAAFLGNAIGSATDAAAPARNAVNEAARHAGEQLTSAAGAAANTAGAVARAAREGVAGVATQAAGAMSDAASSATRSTAQLGSTIRSNLADTFERQPLLIGAIGLVIGGAIASAFPSTGVEKELVGEQAGAAKEKASEFIAQQAEKASRVVERTAAAVREEAEAQGLTPKAAKERVATLRDKARNVATAAVRQNGQPTEH